MYSGSSWVLKFIILPSKPWHTAQMVWNYRAPRSALPRDILVLRSMYESISTWPRLECLVVWDVIEGISNLFYEPLVFWGLPLVLLLVYEWLRMRW